MNVTKRIRTLTIFECRQPIDLARPATERTSAWWPNDQASLDKASRRAAPMIEAIRATAKVPDLPVHFWLENMAGGGTQIVAEGSVWKG